jgi:hypothetical protein
MCFSIAMSPRSHWIRSISTTSESWKAKEREQKGERQRKFWLRKLLDLWIQTYSFRHWWWKYTMGDLCLQLLLWTLPILIAYVKAIYLMVNHFYKAIPSCPKLLLMVRSILRAIHLAQYLLPSSQRTVYWKYLASKKRSSYYPILIFHIRSTTRVFIVLM